MAEFFTERTGVDALFDRFKQKVESLKASNDQDVRDLADLAEYFGKSGRGKSMTVEFLLYKHLLRGGTIAEISGPEGTSFVRRSDDSL